MSIKTAKFVVTPLRGMDQRWDVRPNQASKIENMTWTDQDSWRSSQGYARLVADTDIYDSETTTVSPTNPYDTGASPNSLYWFSQHGISLQWLVYEDYDGRLQYFNGSKANTTSGQLSVTEPRSSMMFIDAEAFDGTAKTRACQGEDVAKTSFAVFGSNLYIVNTVDLPLVFDGRKCSRAGFNTQPSAPFASTNTKTEIQKTSFVGVGYEDSDNAYQYIVTFLNERGQESRMSRASSTISFDTTATGLSGQVAATYKQFVIVDIPTGPLGTVARRIYRSQNMVNFIQGTNVVTLPKDTLLGKEFYFLDEVQDNVCKTFIDGLSDLDLGALSLPQDFGDFPSNVAHLAVYKNTLFVADDQTSEVRYSRALFPEMFPPDNVFNLSDNQTNLITGLYPTRDSLVVFKQRGIYLIKGNPAQGFFGQTLSTDMGCISPQSIRDVPGVGLVFLSSDGVYVLDGTLTNTGQQTRSIKLSQGIGDLFARVNIEFAHKFRSVLYHKDREYWLSVAIDDKTTPDTILKFSYEVGAWSVYTSLEVSGMIEVQDHRGYLILAGASQSVKTGAKGLYLYGSTNKKGDLGVVESVYETVNLPFNSVYENFSPARVQARVVGFGNTLTCEMITNREPGVIATSANGTQLRPLEDQGYPVYGTVQTPSTLTYKEHRPVVVRMDFSTMQKGPVSELRLRFTCSEEMEILNYQLEGRVGSTRDIINLTQKFGGSLTR